MGDALRLPYEGMSPSRVPRVNPIALLLRNLIFLAMVFEPSSLTPADCQGGATEGFGHPAKGL